MLPARTKHIALALLGLAALAFPLVVDNPYLIGVAITAYIMAIAVYGLNILVGYVGQLSLAHAGFFGIAGYTSALLMLRLDLNFWIALPAAILFTCVLGFLVGMIALRTRGSYFAIFTLAVGVIITIILERWEDLTGGIDGLIGVPPPGAIGPLRFESMTGQYYLVLAFLVLTIYFTWALVHSLVGRGFLATRNSEDLARTIGIDVGRTKRLAFVIASAFAALAGGLYASYLGFIGPGMSSLPLTFQMVLYLMLGGVGSLAGPVVGTVLISGMAQVTLAFEQYQLVILGPLLVIIMIFFPQGLVGIWGSIEYRWRSRRMGGEPAPAPPAAVLPTGETREHVHAAPGGQTGD